MWGRWARTHGRRRDWRMIAALPHRISASYVASRSLVWVPVGSKTHKKPTHESLQKIRFIRLERTFDKMKGHGVHQVFTPMKTKRMSRHVHELLVPCVRAAWL